MVYRVMVVAGENEALRALVEQPGENIEVQLLESANDALWEVRSVSPDVLITDMNLADMNGLEMAEIMSNFDLPTRVIVWSREADHAAQQQAENSRIFRFLQGSISSEDLGSIIKDAIAAAPAIPLDPEPEPEPELEPEPEPEPERPREREKPARVVLERSPASSSAPSPAPAPSRSRLTSRATRRLSPTEQPPPEPQEPSPAATQQPGRWQGSGSTLVLTADNLNPIRNIMSQLSQELGPQCIMLTDRAGMVLVEVGNTQNLPTMILLPLLSTSFSTAGEVARQLGEEDATTLYIHEGINYDLYCFDIAQRFLLVLVFNKKIASSKIGAVWVNTKRAIRELQEALASQ